MSEPRSFFKVACQDAARIVSLLSLNSSHVTTPPKDKTFFQRWRDKSVFFGRFFHMVFVKGFTPVVFDMMPYRLWQLLTFGIYVVRLVVLPAVMRLSGMGKAASWEQPAIGAALPARTDAEAVCNSVPSLTQEGRLATVNFGDQAYERLLLELHRKTCHLSPHSQSPGHPFVSGFPGNFMDHLTGVYKILFAWKQPQFVVRAGLYHSVYGTYDYRAGVFDLKDGRDQLRSVVGPGAEELAFAICTSDRLGLIFDLLVAMYGQQYVSGWGILANIKRSELQSVKIDGNAYPPLQGELTDRGFPVRNHITQRVHFLPPAFFAHFVVVFAADFMDQGALPFGSTDMDICLFQFLRFRFFNDVIRFVSRYLYVVPPVFKKYMWDASFLEPTRADVQLMTRLWARTFKGEQRVLLSSQETQAVSDLIKKCPYLAEPRLVLAASLGSGESFEGQGKAALAAAAREVIEEWGMLSIKNEDISLEAALGKIQELVV